MSIKEAYSDGAEAALRAFSLEKNAAARGLIYRPSPASNAAANPGGAMFTGKNQVRKNVSFAPTQAPGAPAPAAGATGKVLPAWADRAWSGVNKFVSNPVGGLVAGTGLMMGMSKLMEPSQER